MQAFIGFDDTDTLDADRGTGKLARWFGKDLPPGCVLWGVVRQQLLVHPAIPYTSHNSSACVVVNIPDESVLDELIASAVSHIERHFIPGSDPGLCVATDRQPEMARLIDFGQACTRRVVSREDARQAAVGMHLSGHGGTLDGIIGAAAAVGLTVGGWNGRFIEYHGLREIPEEVEVAVLMQRGIIPVPIQENAPVPGPADIVVSSGWLRPRLRGGSAVLPVLHQGSRIWECADKKAYTQVKEGNDGR
jgi:tRNA(Ile2) C34 agmatinyltransferase TiaS